MTLCHYCKKVIKGPIRYLTVNGKRVAFHKGTFFNACIDAYLVVRSEPIRRSA